jgi:ferredoxin
MQALATPYPENAPGKFYVTTDCNGCGLCFMHALQNMMYSNDSSYYYVYYQPVDPREEEDLRKAIEVCPMNCIRDDGLAS